MRFTSVSFVLALLVGALYFSTPQTAAFAQACNETGYTYNSACSGNATKSSGSVSGSATTVAASQATTGLVISRLNRVTTAGNVDNLNVGSGTTELFSFGRGEAAGDPSERRLGVWANAAYLRAEGSKSNADFDSDIITGMVGADYAVNDKLLIGLGIGYENQSTETGYNRGETDGDGISGTTYFSYQINKTYGVTGALGYSRMSYDHLRLDPLSNARITGSNDADRYFGSVNGTGSWVKGPVTLGAGLGTLYILEKQDAFTESNGTAVASETISVGQVNVTGSAAYRIGVAEPYISGLAGYDYNDAGGSYDNAFGLSGSLGSNFYVTDELFLNAQAIGQYREDLTIYGGSATVRYQLKW